jgi:hypothetical protein
VEEEPAHLCKDESMAEVSLGGDRKKMSGGPEDTLRQDALKRADSAVCRRVISCSRGHYHRTEQALAHYIELARIEDGGNISAVTKPVNPGQSYSGVPRLPHPLRLVGDLPAERS